MGKRASVEVGAVYGRLEVLGNKGKNKHGKYYAECLCSCGNKLDVLEACLKSNHTQSCGCYKSEVASERLKVDYSGMKFAKLTLLRDVGKIGQGERLWECLCECGNLTVTRGAHVKFGHVKSCGCLQIENTKKANITHGMSKSSEYYTYRGMLERCYNKNNEKYRIYGARGITVSEEWIESFTNFFRDMGCRPENLTLERKDVNGNYDKDNCIWDTPNEQAFNQRGNKNNTSGQVGVDFYEGRWRARIWKDNVCYRLGSFKSFEEARTARLEGELKFYGYLKERENNESSI